MFLRLRFPSLNCHVLKNIFLRTSTLLNVQARCINSKREGLERSFHISSLSTMKSSEDDECMSKFPKRHMRIFACGELYEKWNRERKYWSVPKEDIPFDIIYLDTETKNPLQKCPVVVALHGSPGSADNFTHLMSYFDQNGVRFIAPEFPELMAHKLKVFRHTPEEKCQLIKDFLQKIGIPRVDMLICHSISHFSGLLMCLQGHSPDVRSLALLNPVGFEFPWVMRHHTVLKVIARLMELPGGYPIASFAAKINTMLHSELKQDQPQKQLLSGLAVIQANPPKKKKDLEELLKKDLPIFVAFSENDKLISKKAMQEMASMLVDHEEIIKCDRFGKIEAKCGKDLHRRVISFENGTHYLTRRYPDIIAKELTKFLFENVLQKN